MPEFSDLQTDGWLVQQPINIRKAHWGDYKNDVLAVSHSWESKPHPDTTGVQWKSILEYVRSDVGSPCDGGNQAPVEGVTKGIGEVSPTKERCSLPEHVFTHPRYVDATGVRLLSPCRMKRCLRSLCEDVLKTTGPKRWTLSGNNTTDRCPPRCPSTWLHCVSATGVGPVSEAKDATLTFKSMRSPVRPLVQMGDHSAQRA